MPYKWTLTNLSDMSSEILTRDPIGWDNGIYSIKRSDIYKGAFHEYTTTLKFHCDGGGKSFIDNVYNNEDIDGRIDVLVEYDCDGSGTYETLFNGIINLASYSSDGKYTTANIEKSDLLTKLFARDEINVDLETTTSIGGETISGISTVQLPMHSTEIEFISEIRLEQGYAYSSIESYSSISSDWNAFFTHLAATTATDFDTTTSWTEFDTLGDTKDVASIQASFIQPVLKLNTSGIITPQTVTWEIDFSGTFTDNQTVVGGLRDAQIYKLNLYYGRKDSGFPMSVVTLYDGGTYSSDPFVDNFSIVDTGTITLNAGDEVYLAWYINYETLTGSVTIHDTWVYNASYFRLRGITKYKETESKSVLVHEAFSQVIDAIADSNDNFRSEFYGRTDSQKHTYSSDGCGSSIAITNGLNIREFSEKPILASFKSLFNSFDCLHNIGMGVVNGKIQVEPLAYWFDTNTKLLTLPYVNNYTVTNKNDKYINKIEIGFQKWESEFHGGLDDVNAKHEYATKIASTKTLYQKLCDYIASTYTIEFTRRKNKELLATEDWRYDNNNFVISVTRDAYGNFIPEKYSHAFNTGSDMLSLATAYNLRFTPKRLLLAHLGIVTAGLQKIQGLISFVTGSGNTIFKVAKDDIGCQEDYSGVVLAENDNISWNDSNAQNISPIYGTEMYSFEYPLTYAEFKTIKNNPYGYIEFYKFQNAIMTGYIMNIEYQMKTGMTKFELIKRV